MFTDTLTWILLNVLHDGDKLTNIFVRF